MQKKRNVLLSKLRPEKLKKKKKKKKIFDCFLQKIKNYAFYKKKMQ